MAGCLGRYEILIFVQKAFALSRGFETNLDILGSNGKVSGRLTQQNISGSPQPQSEVGGALLIICTVPAVEACFCFLCNSFRPLVAKTGNTLLFRLKGD